MLQRLPALALVPWTICLALSLGQLVRAAEARPNPWPADKSPGLTALAKAAERNRHAYVFFWKTEGEATRRKREAFDAALATLGDRADASSVCVSAPEEKATVDAFKISRAPMPLVLAIAPNGAVTKAWPLDFQAATAGDGIVSAGAASCMKALQGNKMVLVSVPCPPGDAGVDAMFKAFSDVTRLRILHLLLAGEMCVGDLATIVEATQPRASQHLACLRAAGLVTCRREGLWSYYSLARPTTTFHKKLLECLRHCFSEVPELQADDRRAAKLAKAAPCCPPASPRRRTPRASR